MKRRTMFKTALLATGAAALPFSAGFANIPSRIKNVSNGFRRFMLGDLELTIVSDGSIVFSPVQPFFAPGVDPSLIKKMLTDHFRPADAMTLSINILVIRKKDKLILVDTGTGPGGTGTGWMMQSLAAAGFEPAAITDIIISHAHPDHIGGVLTATGQPAFPNANIYLSAIEKNFWMGDKPDFSKCKVTDPAILKSIMDVPKKIIPALGTKLHLFNESDHLLDCIRFELAAGHTPGHMLTIVYSGQEELVHIADLVHSDVLLFPHPEWGFFGDTDFAAGAATRARVFEELAQSRKKVMAYHLAWPGLGHVRKADTGYEWVPEPIPYPG